MLDTFSGLLANVLLTVTSDHVCRIWREGILSSSVQFAESISSSIDLTAGSGRLASELDLLTNYSVYHLRDYIRRFASKFRLELTPVPLLLQSRVCKNIHVCV